MPRRTMYERIMSFQTDFEVWEDDGTPTPHTMIHTVNEHSAASLFCIRDEKFKGHWKKHIIVRDDDGIEYKFVKDSWGPPKLVGKFKQGEN